MTSSESKLTVVAVFIVDGGESEKTYVKLVMIMFLDRFHKKAHNL